MLARQQENKCTVKTFSLKISGGEKKSAVRTGSFPAGMAVFRMNFYQWSDRDIGHGTPAHRYRRITLCSLFSLSYNRPCWGSLQLENLGQACSSILPSHSARAAHE